MNPKTQNTKFGSKKLQTSLYRARCKMLWRWSRVWQTNERTDGEGEPLLSNTRSADPRCEPRRHLLFCYTRPKSVKLTHEFSTAAIQQAQLPQIARVGGRFYAW